MVTESTQTAPDMSSLMSQNNDVYDKWLEKEGVKVYEGYYVEDTRTLELRPWARRECKAAFLKLSGQEGISEAHVIEIAPGQTLRAITDEVTDFVMPGSVIPGFARKAAQIAQAGIYDLRIHHDDVIMPLVRHWRVFETEGLDAEGEQARQELAAALETLDARAARFVARRAEAEAERAKAGRGADRNGYG